MVELDGVAVYCYVVTMIGAVDELNLQQSFNYIYHQKGTYSAMVLFTVNCYALYPISAAFWSSSYHGHPRLMGIRYDVSQIDWEVSNRPAIP